MMIRCLLPVFLVLAQSGLAVAAYAHVHPHRVNHTEAPHLHAHDLLDLFGSDHGDEDDHDADAVDLSDMMASAVPPPAVDAVALDLTSVDAGPAFAEIFGPSPAPLGLPPPTAGPHRPLYLTFCTLTI